ncbi:MAG: alpha/beta hydrolase [Anaerolineaceae bacterium]|nr:alpha/beta hydrolase [Anaerolineaceae bacterium]
MPAYASINDQKARLPDGRYLGYAEYGDLVGKPVMVFPGAPSSRILPLRKDQAAELGVRLIVVERPGFGLSDFKKGRRLLDWPKDVASFADELGLEEFAVVGISAGGPYAAVCASKLPQRIKRVAIIGGVGPMDHEEFADEMPRIRKAGIKIARKVPWMLTVLLSLFFNPQLNPEAFYERILSGNSALDQAKLRNPEMKSVLIRNYQEATREGMQGFANEAVILSDHWGFDLKDIQIPVDVWHGEKDENVSLSAARHLVQNIPDCTAHFLPEQGHWLHLEYWREILTALIE